MSEAVLWMLITVIGTVGTALFGYAAYRLCRMMARGRQGFVPRQLRWAYPARGGDSDAADAVLLARFRLVLFFTLTMLWLALLAVSHNVAPWPWLLYAMMALSTAAWLAAMAENLLLPARIAAAGVLGKIKWGLMLLWVTGMFVGLLSVGFSNLL